MLEQELIKYTSSNAYPFHMPGHKRQGLFGADPYQLDITEICDFDNLHEPQGLILEMMKRAEKLYGSKKSFLLVNGSTVGNLAAIYSATKQGGSIIMGRNCHKSVYHAAQIRQLSVCYTNPSVSPMGMILKTDMEEYHRAISSCPEATAIVVTSPTYEGMVEDLDRIVELAHKHKMAVIVDAAHGAHFPFHRQFPESPLASGADIVIMSLHKTLPALTQTALLHVNKDSVICEEEIANYLSVFETSSPSYVLLSSIGKCLDFLEHSGQAFADYVDKLDKFYEDCKQLKYISLEHRTGQDKGKLVFDTRKGNISGYELMERLRLEDAIELEMASFHYGLAMSSVMDCQEGFDRLLQGLLRIDADCEQSRKEDICVNGIYDTGEKAMEMYEAIDREKELISLKNAAGRVAGDMVSLYPPGVPVLVPGEIISQRSIEILELAIRQGLQVNGLKEMTEGEKGIQAVVN